MKMKLLVICSLVVVCIIGSASGSALKCDEDKQRASEFLAKSDSYKANPGKEYKGVPRTSHPSCNQIGDSIEVSFNYCRKENDSNRLYQCKDMRVSSMNLYDTVTGKDKQLLMPNENNKDCKLTPLDCDDLP